MSIQTGTWVVCDRCGLIGPSVTALGPAARPAKEAAANDGWARVKNADFGKGKGRGMDDLCPTCKIKPKS